MLRCKAHEILRNEAYLVYAAMTDDAAQRSRWTFSDSLLETISNCTP